jgi:hypothetical protein
MIFSKTQDKRAGGTGGAPDPLGVPGAYRRRKTVAYELTERAVSELEVRIYREQAPTTAIDEARTRADFALDLGDAVTETKAAPPLSEVAGSCSAVNHLPESAVREIRTLRFVGTGGGRPPPVTRLALGNERPYRR